MNERLELALAYVTIAMPIVLVVLHGLRAITTRLRVYALTTPETWDDKATARVLRVLDGLDALVDAVSVVIPRPPARRDLNPTPHLEAVLGTPSAGNATEADPNDSMHRRLP